ncbi:MAG: NUDIX domain-containing protein [Phycisphaerae bacterium]|jgi:ADP-ribose pyrophosphatase YjhB (NUDIX family)
MAQAKRKTWVDSRALVEGRPGEFLIVRPHGPTEESPWEFPGGPLRAHESPEGALRRICADTLGIALEIHVGQPPFVYNYGTHSVTYRYFMCGSTGSVEASGYKETRWVLAGQLREYVFEPACQRVVDWILQSSDNDRT